MQKSFSRNVLLVTCGCSGLYHSNGSNAISYISEESGANVVHLIQEKGLLGIINSEGEERNNFIRAVRFTLEGCKTNTIFVASHQGCKYYKHMKFRYFGEETGQHCGNLGQVHKIIKGEFPLADVRLIYAQSIRKEGGEEKLSFTFLGGL